MIISNKIMRQDSSLVAFSSSSSAIPIHHHVVKYFWWDVRLHFHYTVFSVWSYTARVPKQHSDWHPCSSQVTSSEIPWLVQTVPIPQLSRLVGILLTKLSNKYFVCAQNRYYKDVFYYFYIIKQYMTRVEPNGSW